DSMWVSLAAPAGSPAGQTPARLVRVHADGTVDPQVLVPDDLDGLSRKGGGGPIACPGADQCWLATSLGWLFHLGDAPAPDEDPAMHVLITTRPADNSVPVVPPDTIPNDDSGANPGSVAPPAPSGDDGGDDSQARAPKAKRLVTKQSSKLLAHSTTLELTF